MTNGGIDLVILKGLFSIFSQRLKTYETYFNHETVFLKKNNYRHGFVSVPLSHSNPQSTS